MVPWSLIFVLANIEVSQKEGFLDVGLPHALIYPQMKRALTSASSETKSYWIGWIPCFLPNCPIFDWSKSSSCRNRLFFFFFRMVGLYFLWEKASFGLGIKKGKKIKILRSNSLCRKQNQVFILLFSLISFQIGLTMNLGGYIFFKERYWGIKWVFSIWKFSSIPYMRSCTICMIVHLIKSPC